MTFVLHNHLPAKDARTNLVKAAVLMEIERVLDVAPVDLTSFELSLLDVAALDNGHLGLYDITGGKWMKIAAGEARPIISNPRLGFRLVDDSILGAIRHEFGHHLWNRKYTVRRMWNEFFREKGLGQWFRKNVSLYAGSNREEAWCECFSAFVTDLAIPEELEKVVADILLSCGE